MAHELVGYARLAEQFQLPIRPLECVAVIDTTAKVRQTVPMGGYELIKYEPRYRPDASLTGQLQFALRYEGLNLELLHLLFAQTGRAEIEDYLRRQPESGFARRLGFLYEWLTGQEINNAVVPKAAAYIPVVDEALRY